MVERDPVAAENASRSGTAGEEVGQVLDVVRMAGNGGRDEGRWMSGI